MRPLAFLIAATLGLGSLGGCASAPGPTPPAPVASATATPAPAATATPVASDAPSGTADTVRLALDWTPNTNHTGFFVAERRGWYADAGIDLELLPYTGATPESLVAGGRADCAISFEDAMTFAVAAGAELTSVMAILQRTAQEIAVLATSSAGRPRDLDGRVYAGFGYPNEVPTVRSVIRADGGRGEFEVATLSTAAYEALYAGRADFAIVFTAWEGIEAAARGIELRTFPFTDHGFPDFYQVVLACDRGWLAESPEVARRFVGATVRGFEVAAREPAAAAAELVAANPGVFAANPDLPLASARFLADGGYYLDGRGDVGRQTLERWTAYPRFLFEEGLLTGPDGAPLAEPLDPSALFTNEFLP
ncbi:MAG: hypothetical protein RL338_1071 [Chloroflexota bacterium]